MNPGVLAAFFAAGFCAIALRTSAQPGSLDISFNPGHGIDAAAFCFAAQTNGQILVGGDFLNYNGESRHHVTKLNPDGSLDTEFLPLDGPDGTVRAIATTDDGKVLIGGDFFAVNGISRRHLARLRRDGSLDLGFPEIQFNSRVTTLKRIAEGKYLILGEFTSVNGANLKQVARLESNGTVDVGFYPASRISNGMVRTAAIQPDGKVILAGDFQTVDNTNRMFIARVFEDGSLDSSFDAGFIGGVNVLQVLIQPDGKLIVAGDFGSINGYSRASVARLNPDGSVDRGFVWPYGSISPSAVALQPDGKCIFGGAFFGGPQPFLVRLNSNGTMDADFTPELDGNITALLLQSNGKVLLSGYFRRIGETNINRIARVNGDATSPVGLKLLDANKYFGASLGGTVGNTYRIEWTTNLNSSSLWSPLFNVTIQTNPQFILDPVPISGRQRFYRAVSLP